MGPVLKENELIVLENMKTRRVDYFTAYNRAAQFLDTTTPVIYNFIAMTKKGKTSSFRGEQYQCTIEDCPGVPYCKINPDKYRVKAQEYETAMLKINAETR